MTDEGACIFCEIVAGSSPATILWHNDFSLIIEPLNPVTPGHVIALPKTHVDNFSEEWLPSAEVMEAVFQYTRNLGMDYNVITSSGHSATQTVRHLHVHVIPRVPGDGLLLPWSNQQAKLKKEPKVLHHV